MSDFLRPQGLQHTRFCCPSLSPRDSSNSRPLSRWSHPTIYPLSLLSPPAVNLSQHQSLFQGVSSSHQVPKKYWSFSFSISPSSEYSGYAGLIGFISLLSKGLWRVFSSAKIQSINYLTLGLLCGPTLTFIDDYWNNWSISLTTGTFVSKVMSLLLNALSTFVIDFHPRNKCLLMWG